MIKFICYPKCSTCKKAQNFLDKNSMDYELRDIKSENPTYEELKSWHDMSGIPLKKFFNTSGMLYRSMELKDKLDAMSEDEQLRLLASDGMLVKRPIAISGNTVLLGFNEEKWTAAFKSKKS